MQILIVRYLQIMSYFSPLWQNPFPFVYRSFESFTPRLWAQDVC